MEDLLKNKIVLLCLGLLLFNIFVFVAGKVIVNKAADQVIERLEKDYSPSPYGPGFNADQVNPESLRAQREYFEMSQQQSASFVVSDEEPSPVIAVTTAGIWRDDWERERGFSQ